MGETFNNTHHAVLWLNYHSLGYLVCTRFDLGPVVDLMLRQHLLVQHRSNIKPSILGLYKYIIGC
jgi:YD repeat-containing protein